ncbi:MAG: hypothetical protein FWE67_01010 [Planctomycetaceae bacterium]|nr:hypothetical protein [Planctomycetaceae bacterium]
MRASDCVAALSHLTLFSAKRDDDFFKKTSPIQKKILGNLNPIGIFTLHCWTGEHHDDAPVEIDCYGYYLGALIALWIADERSLSPDGAIIYAAFDGKRTALDFIGEANLEVM